MASYVSRMARDSALRRGSRRHPRAWEAPQALGGTPGPGRHARRASPCGEAQDALERLREKEPAAAPRLGSSPVGAPRSRLGGMAALGDASEDPGRTAGSGVRERERERSLKS